MSRTALITPHSLGALEAYRMVITDISEVLGDPHVDIERLFFATMIQSGVEAFIVPEHYRAGLEDWTFIRQRIEKRDYSRVETVAVELENLFTRTKRASLSDKDEKALRDITTLIQELYIAAEFRRPIVTVLGKPPVDRVRDVLREDVATVVEELLRQVATIGIEAPVVKMEVEKVTLARFRAIVESDAFGTYIERHELFETLSQRLPSAAERVSLQTRALVRTFPSVVAFRNIAVRALDVVPQLVDLVGGKALGAAAKPFATALSAALGREQRLVAYSFYPTWRRIWEGKLDKVRSILHEERARRSAGTGDPGLSR